MSLSNPLEDLETVSIAGRSYKVTRAPDGHNWWLFGSRGAKYRTQRRADGLMFLIGHTKPGRIRVDPLGDVLLTDAEGILKEA